MDDELNSRLKPLRDRIDAIDAQLIALLNQRAAVALEVGEVKKHFNAPVFRPERELQVIARLQDMSAGPLASEHISAIWREIMAASRALEQTIHVAFLGPVGTYSEQAMLSISASRSKGCRARRSTRCSARSRPARPRSVSRRSRIRPKAPCRARSTYCCRRNC